MAKYQLNQKVNVIHQGKTIEATITKRIKLEDLDTNKILIYYDYKHLNEVYGVEAMYEFTNVLESVVDNKIKLALNILG